jgi:hypothetical protein
MNQCMQQGPSESRWADLCILTTTFEYYGDYFPHYNLVRSNNLKKKFPTPNRYFILESYFDLLVELSCSRLEVYATSYRVLFV